MELQLFNFCDDKVSKQYSAYKNNIKCKEFIGHIAEDLIETELSLDQDSFISVLADGSTDKKMKNKKWFLCVCLKTTNLLHNL